MKAIRMLRYELNRFMWKNLKRKQNKTKTFNDEKNPITSFREPAVC
jgi:hypothetical protein